MFNPNPRLLKNAQKWMNKELPEEKPNPPVTSAPQSPSFRNVDYMFVDGAEGQSILEEYNQRVSRDYNGASALNVLSFADNVLKGSNPFAFVLLDKILGERGKRIATPADLERALEKEAINLRETYGDSGLVLRSDGEPNEYLGRYLINQIHSNQSNIEYPLMIPLEGLDLEYDESSPHKLSFILTDSTELIHAPQFDLFNNGKKFDKGDEKGLPIFDENGSRTLYTGEGGLRRLFRDGSLDLSAGDGGLASSNGDGRVVVCAEGTLPKN